MSDRRIQLNFIELCNALNVDQVLPYLRQERMLTADEYEQLNQSSLSQRAKREKLLIILPRKGRDHFEVFSKCLVWSGQSELAVNIGVDVAKVPPCPYLSRQRDEAADMRKLLRNLPTGSVPPSSSEVCSNGAERHQECGPYQPSSCQVPLEEATPIVPHTEAPPPAGPKSVFLLYCKDDQGYPSREDILGLADVLTQCGILCSCDLYSEAHPPDNWNMWTTDQINKNDHTLLVCSPLMSSSVQTAQDQLMEMHCGSYYNYSIVNLVVPKKFIPIFLNQSTNKDWVPDHLKTVSRYELQLARLAQEVSGPEQLGEAIGSGRCPGLSSLLSRLLGMPLNPRPRPSSVPVLPQHRGGGGSSQVQETTMMKIAEYLPRDWQHLGIRLGLSYSRLEALREAHIHDTRKAAMGMFGLWQVEKGEAATRTALKDALVALGYGRLAREEFPDLFQR